MVGNGTELIHGTGQITGQENRLSPRQESLYAHPTYGQLDTQHHSSADVLAFVPVFWPDMRRLVAQKTKVTAKSDLLVPHWHDGQAHDA